MNVKHIYYIQKKQIFSQLYKEVNNKECLKNFWIMIAANRSLLAAVC